MPSLVSAPDSYIYKLHYKKGGNYHHWRLFNFKGDLIKAIPAAREYCRQQGFTFLQVDPAFVDFAAAEKELDQED